jgi:hypothetical protein
MNNNDYIDIGDDDISKLYSGETANDILINTRMKRFELTCPDARTTNAN